MPLVQADKGLAVMEACRAAMKERDEASDQMQQAKESFATAEIAMLAEQRRLLALFPSSQRGRTIVGFENSKEVVEIIDAFRSAFQVYDQGRNAMAKAGQVLTAAEQAAGSTKSGLMSFLSGDIQAEKSAVEVKISGV